jgi:hypothetical protein
MGGTNIVSPLSDIYNDKVYNNINLSKNIFLLTDGQIYDRDECIKLITANSDKFRIHALGIGYDFDEILIERSGKLSKGSSVFVKDIKDIKTAVINSLNSGLRDYLIDLKFNFIHNEEKLKNSIIKLNPKNDFSYQDEIITFSFILDDNNKIDIDKINEDIKLEITGKKSEEPFVEIVNLKKGENIMKIIDGDELSKIIVGQGLKYNKEFINDKEKEIAFSQKYQVLSKNTALYAEIKKFNDFQQKKLIVVDLDKYPRFESSQIYNHVYTLNGPIGGIPKIEANIARKVSYSSFIDEFQFQDTEFLTESITTSMSADDIINTETIDLVDTEPTDSCIRCQSSNKRVGKEGDNLLKLIMTQNIIEGYWDENDETKKLIEILPKNIIEEIEKKIKNLNKNDENKIKYTIIVLYYLKNYQKEKLEENKIIINKANKFLINNGIKYEEIIDEH